MEEQNEERALVTTAGPILPSAEGARSALETYLEIQRVFDEKMPDAIMEIQGKKFRKKAYWRAIATAFNVTCEVITVDRLEVENPEPPHLDWGYTATVRATSADGRTSDGDGACMQSEKRGAMGTVHNVRSHAITRAKNRAISDLVGFGEVSADELGPDAYRDPPPDEVPKAPNQPAGNQPRGKAASEKQMKLLYAKSRSRAEALLNNAIQTGVTPKIHGEKETREEIARLAKARVGCGDTILAKEIDPLLVAIELIDYDEEGVLGYVGGLP